MKSMYIFLCIHLISLNSLSAAFHPSELDRGLLASASDSSLGLAIALNRAAQEAKWDIQTTEDILWALVKLHAKAPKKKSPKKYNRIQKYLFGRYCGKVIGKNPKKFGEELYRLHKDGNLNNVRLARNHEMKDIE